MQDAIDRLYDLPPSEFTAARDTIVKQLRAEKRRNEANEVKSLRRPTVPAWAVNQVARRHPDVVEELIAAGNTLASAQRRALSGVKESGMRDAAQQRRSAVDRAWRAAAEILREADVDPAAHRQAVSDTFEAATADAQAAEEVRTGHLSKELPPPSGFGGVTGFSVVADGSDQDEAPTAQPPPAPQPATDGTGDDAAAARRQAQREAERAARRAREEAQEAAQRADAAARRGGDARQAAVRAVAEADRLEQRARRARDRADDLLAKADQAEGDATAAAAEAQRLAAAAAEAQEQAAG